MSTLTWGDDPILTDIFQVGWFNHQLVLVFRCVFFGGVCFRFHSLKSIDLLICSHPFGKSGFSPRDFPSINMMCSGFGFGFFPMLKTQLLYIPLRPFDTFMKNLD